MDIAPEVSLYLANPQSFGDLRNTVDWMISEGVSVINHSRSWTFDGPGDGTSPFTNSPLKTVDRAVDAGIIWANTAGNHANNTWFGAYSDPEDDDFINFNGTDETSSICNFWKGDSIRVQLRWDDSWDRANRDFDLGIWDFADEEIIAYSFDPQLGNVAEVPYEQAGYLVTDVMVMYGVLVDSTKAAPFPIGFKVTVWGTDSIEYTTPRTAA